MQSSQLDLPDDLKQLIAELNPQSSQNATKRVKFDSHSTADRGKELDTKEAYRKAMIDIIAEMQEKADFVKCLEIEKEATKRGISKPTFYRRLAELAKEGILEKKEISHRDIRYRLNYERLPRGQKQVLLFKRQALMKINEHMDQIAKKNDEQEIIKELGKWIGALSLFTLMEQIDTGYPFADAVNYYLTQPSGAPKYLRHIVVFRSGKIMDPLKDYGEMVRLLTDAPLGGDDEYSRKLFSLFETAREKLYPLEFDEFKLIYEEGIAGQPLYEPGDITKKLIRQRMEKDRELRK